MLPPAKIWLVKSGVKQARSSINSRFLVSLVSWFAIRLEQPILGSVPKWMRIQGRSDWEELCHKEVASYLGFETCCGSLQGQSFILGALCPSKSGLLVMNIEQTYRETYRFVEIPLENETLLYAARARRA